MKLPPLSSLLAPFMMLFFAFTGWEVAAGVSEEFRDPKRDFPRAMIASFILATLLYLAIAFLVQRTDISGFYESPFAAVIAPILGRSGSWVVAAAVLLITANLSGVIWGVSRLVFSLAREKIVPSVLERTTAGSPRLAVLSVTAVLLGRVGDRPSPGMPPSKALDRNEFRAILSDIETDNA